MRFTDFRNLKRFVFILVLVGVSLAYMQLVAMEHWDKFVNFRTRISQNMRIGGGGGNDIQEEQTTADDMNLIYFEYNETEMKKKLADYDNPNDDYKDDADDHEKAADGDDKAGFRDTDEVDSGNTSKINHWKSSVNQIIGHRKYRNRFQTIDLKRLILNETDFTTKPLMVLFSSWVSSSEKAKVHSILRRLWNAWPSIKPVVLTKDSVVQKECRNAGWGVQTVTDSDSRCYGPPVLSTMFTDVFKRHDAYFYGYSNADIIFGDGLEKTMSFLYNYFSPWKTKPVLVVGRRHNVNFVKYANFTLNTPHDVDQLTKMGTLVIRSTDYFFTNRHFPWGKAPKVTIGRPFVVRAIIGWALQRGYYVIDATNTIQSVHLTTQDGVFASWHKKGVMCNQRVLGALRWSIPVSIGHCECARLETFKGKNNTIKLRHRPPNRKLCGR
ncbi:uncharacterized protein LOC123528912 [Mercenaria mercenaria]|uniref:uncharacterized protein LOC123528912 n=1 Tax=Mercenaria mercenaria TaxID=6596 RepID=UPI00234EE3BE|nr:uncharacterized protein LOC123528912 [Mercenaria mercenaria]